MSNRKTQKQAQLERIYRKHRVEINACKGMVKDIDSRRSGKCSQFKESTEEERLAIYALYTKLLDEGVSPTAAHKPFAPNRFFIADIEDWLKPEQRRVIFKRKEPQVLPRQQTLDLADKIYVVHPDFGRILVNQERIRTFLRNEKGALKVV